MLKYAFFIVFAQCWFYVAMSAPVMWSLTVHQRRRRYDTVLVEQHIKHIKTLVLGCCCDVLIDGVALCAAAAIVPARVLLLCSCFRHSFQKKITRDTYPRIFLSRNLSESRWWLIKDYFHPILFYRHSIRASNVTSLSTIILVRIIFNNILIICTLLLVEPIYTSAC